MFVGADCTLHPCMQYAPSVRVTQTFQASHNISGPDTIPPWIVKDVAQQLAGPVTSIFNSSLREGVLPKLWIRATVIPLPKKRPPESIENDIRPIALTPILAKVFESIVLNGWTISLSRKLTIYISSLVVWPEPALLTLLCRCYTYGTMLLMNRVPL